MTTAAEVRTVLEEVGKGGDPVKAGERLRSMGLEPPARLTSVEAMRGEDVDLTPGSVQEVYLAEQRGVITAAQSDAILKAYLS